MILLNCEQGIGTVDGLGLSRIYFCYQHCYLWSCCPNVITVLWSINLWFSWVISLYQCSSNFIKILWLINTCTFLLPFKKSLELVPVLHLLDWSMWLIQEICTPWTFILLRMGAMSQSL